LPAVLSEGNGPEVSHLITVGAAEHRSENRIKRAACLSVIERQRDREFGERRFSREAQGTRASGQASGPAFLLGTFLWRGKEKYLAR